MEESLGISKASTKIIERFSRCDSNPSSPEEEIKPGSFMLDSAYKLNDTAHLLQDKVISKRVYFPVSICIFKQRF